MSGAGRGGGERGADHHAAVLTGRSGAAEPAAETAQIDHPGGSGPPEGKVGAADLHLSNDHRAVGGDATRIAVAIEDGIDVLAVTCRRRAVGVRGLLPEHVETTRPRARRHRAVRRQINHAERSLKRTARPASKASGLPGGLPPDVAAGDHRSVVGDRIGLVAQRARLEQRQRDHPLRRRPPVRPGGPTRVNGLPHHNRAIERGGPGVATAAAQVAEDLIPARGGPPERLVIARGDTSGADDHAAVPGDAQGLRAAGGTRHLAQSLETSPACSAGRFRRPERGRRPH